MPRHRKASRPDEGGWHLSHDVKVWKIRVYDGRKRRSYAVRWAVSGKEHHRAFQTRALAEGFRAKLISYMQRGAPFDIDTGLPEPMLREQQTRSWYEHACRYVDMKWPHLAPMSRRSIAESLATVTPGLLTTDRGRPPMRLLRRALYEWVFVGPRRNSSEPPDDLVSTIRWLESHTVAITDLQDQTYGARLVRSALDLLALRLNGKPAAPNTVARKRAVFYNVLEYAVEEGLLAANPIDHLGWRTPKTAETVDRRSAVNPEQARRLLAAVGAQGATGRRLVAFFALMYYAALRPSEVMAIRTSNLSLPESGWGEILLEGAAPRTGLAWSNTGRSREEGSLKHRARGDVRHVPAHPQLVRHLVDHLREFGTAADGRLFVGPLGGQIMEATYLAVWREARKATLTSAAVASPLARRPYDLRHAAVSTWLNAGVPATQVAEWAGHSVAVLLRVYAKCIVGQDDAARRRIEDATQPNDSNDDKP
jgi:integrase